MISKIFIDSSVLIETYKGNKIEFYNHLFSGRNNQFFINEVVLSEYLYFVLGFHNGVSPRTLQQKNLIGEAIINEPKQIDILQELRLLTANQGFILEVPSLMTKYNLLPNDAIILATCKLHQTALASHDSDFIIPCEEENIELIRDI